MEMWNGEIMLRHGKLARKKKSVFVLGYVYKVMTTYQLLILFDVTGST